MSDEVMTTTRAAETKPGLLARVARGRVESALRAIDEGELVLEAGPDPVVFRGPRPGPRATVVVDDERLFAALALRGVLGGAEAYMNGWWRSDDLVAVIRLLVRNAGAFDALERGSAWMRPGLRLFHRLRDNDRSGSRRNIEAHYDLGNDFFATFLDETLTYSSAVFDRLDVSLEAAQTAKYERLCRKLGLRADHRLLEIGSGWGGLALHAARTRGCHVTTTTISREQHALARERIEKEGLADRVEVLLEDYRDLSGTYDRLVSIEMIEAVGHRHLEHFFQVCSNRLAPDGRMAIQAILVPEHAWESSKRGVDFIKRYIFPGGQLVGLGAISQALAATGLRLSHYEDITPHYAETLRRWRERFRARRSEIASLGMDERFMRTWDFYFAYCEGAFLERTNLTAQMVFDQTASRRGSLAEPGESMMGETT